MSAASPVPGKGDPLSVLSSSNDRDVTKKHTLSYPYLGFNGMTSPFLLNLGVRWQQPPLKSQSRQVSDLEFIVMESKDNFT